MQQFIIFLIFIFSPFSAQADDLITTKNNILSKFSNSLASGIDGGNNCLMWPEEPVVTIALTD
mgnify:CR=1 FL=1